LEALRDFQRRSGAERFTVPNVPGLYRSRFAGEIRIMAGIRSEFESQRRSDHPENGRAFVAFVPAEPRDNRRKAFQED